MISAEARPSNLGVLPKLQRLGFKQFTKTKLYTSPRFSVDDHLPTRFLPLAVVFASLAFVVSVLSSFFAIGVADSGKSPSSDSSDASNANLFLLFGVKWISGLVSTFLVWGVWFADDPSSAVVALIVFGSSIARGCISTIADGGNENM